MLLQAKLIFVLSEGKKLVNILVFCCYLSTWKHKLCASWCYVKSRTSRLEGH